jgi:hypothetical protein
VRIWSIHPNYLDSKGLVALWRETLLAKKVLEGKTKGYKNHPQLIRFKNAEKPINSINQYLKEVFREAKRRQFNFDGEKINWELNASEINVTQGQVDYEIQHLLKKLKTRDRVKYAEVKTKNKYDCHPLFTITDGDIEEWEILANIKENARR